MLYMLLRKLHHLGGLSHLMFLISSYGTPLAQIASYFALHSYLIGPVAQLIMITLLLTALILC